MKKSSNQNSPFADLLCSRKLTVVLGVVAVLLVILLVVFLGLMPKNPKPEKTPKETLSTVETSPAPLATEPPTDPIPTVQPVVGEVDQAMLPHMAQWYSQNADVAGYVRIPDTNIDNVVMFTPDDPTKYLHRNIEGKFRAGGELLIDARCNLDPETPVLMIHGHNMINGTKFKDLLNYSVDGYVDDHGLIYYTTLYEERTYEIFAAFFDKVYEVDEDVFKFYEFVNPQTEEDFQEGIAYFKSISEFESDITPQFGERLLMLVTCEYSQDNGRFVVIGREKTAE